MHGCHQGHLLAEFQQTGDGAAYHPGRACQGDWLIPMYGSTALPAFLALVDGDCTACSLCGADLLTRRTLSQRNDVCEKKQKQKQEQKHEASGLFVTSMFTANLNLLQPVTELQHLCCCKHA